MGRIRRTERLNLRLTKSQRALIEENAEAAGLTMSEFVIKGACGDLGDRPRSPRRSPEASEVGDALDRRIVELRKTMPRGSAEMAARRELARERAQAALAAQA